MNLTLKRQSYNPWGIISSLIEPSGVLNLVTLEHAYLSAEDSYSPKLPAGTYECVLGPHQLAHGGVQQLYEITNVPGHTGILFHVGNFNDDSDGCVLLGEKVFGTAIMGSKDAFDKFMDFQDGQNFTLEVLA